MRPGTCIGVRSNQIAIRTRITGRCRASVRAVRPPISLPRCSRPIGGINRTLEKTDNRRLPTPPSSPRRALLSSEKAPQQHEGSVILIDGKHLPPCFPSKPCGIYVVARCPFSVGGEREHWAASA